MVDSTDHRFPPSIILLRPYELDTKAGTHTIRANAVVTRRKRLVASDFSICLHQPVVALTVSGVDGLLQVQHDFLALVISVSRESFSIGAGEHERYQPQ